MKRAVMDVLGMGAMAAALALLATGCATTSTSEYVEQPRKQKTVEVVGDVPKVGEIINVLMVVTPEVPEMAPRQTIVIWRYAGDYTAKVAMISEAIFTGLNVSSPGGSYAVVKDRETKIGLRRLQD